MQDKRHLVENFGPEPIRVVRRDGGTEIVEPGAHVFCTVQAIRHGDSRSEYSVRPEYSEDGGRAVPRVIADALLGEDVRPGFLLHHERTYQGVRLSDLSDEKLAEARDAMERSIADAPGFVSAKEYAKDLKHVVAEANRRGLNFVNRYPIVRG